VSKTTSAEKIPWGKVVKVKLGLFWKTDFTLSNLALLAKFVTFLSKFKNSFTSFAK